MARQSFARDPSKPFPVSDPEFAAGQRISDVGASEPGQRADLSISAPEESGDNGWPASRTASAVVESDQGRGSTASGAILWGALFAQANIGRARNRFSAAMNQAAWR